MPLSGREEGSRVVVHLSESGGVMSDLGTLGGLSSTAWSINASGTIVGASGTGAGNHAFISSGGIMSDLGTLGTSSFARSINDAGVIVGQSNPGTGNVAFVY